MTAPHTFEQAFIGRVMIISADEEVPETWQDCDGRTIYRYEWPRYFAEMGISKNSITLPKQFQVTEGTRAVIKLG